MMEGKRSSREQQELCWRLGKPGKLRGTLQVRAGLVVDRRPRRSRSCTLLGLDTCTTLADYSLLQRVYFTACALAVARHLSVNPIDNLNLNTVAFTD